MACGPSIAKAVLSDLHRKHSLKILNSATEELGEVPLTNRLVAYRAFGKGPHTLLFFPGNLNSRWFRAAWEKTESIAIKHNFRVVMVDRPGVGASSLPVVSMSIEWYFFECGLTN
jgi:pimeloyl-ACP methyl ester carboxylesterase